MRVRCPKCGEWGHATATISPDYWEIKKCLGMVNSKQGKTACGYSGHVNINGKQKGFTNVKGQESAGESKDLFD